MKKESYIRHQDDEALIIKWYTLRKDNADWLNMMKMEAIEKELGEILTKIRITVLERVAEKQEKKYAIISVLLGIGILISMFL